MREAFKVFDGVRYKTWEKSPKVSNIQSIQPTLWRDGCLYIYKSPSSPPSLSRSTLNVIFCRMATGISTGMSSQSWWPTLGRSLTLQKFKSWPPLKRSFVSYLSAYISNKFFIIDSHISNFWSGPFVYTETTNNSFSGNDWRSRCRWRRSNQLRRILQHDDIMFAESVCQKINNALFKLLI